MPRLLRYIPYSEALLANVQGFDCGDTDWGREAAAWLCSAERTGDCALGAINGHGTAVWLFATPEDGLVGYGSLGKTKWRLPNKKSDHQPISIIPWVAIQTKFQGTPKEPGCRKFSDQIMTHLLYEACLLCAECPSTGLMVDPGNESIRCYERHGYVRLKDPFNHNGVPQLRMLLNLEKYMHDNPNWQANVLTINEPPEAPASENRS